jgi:DNA processing protein
MKSPLDDESWVGWLRLQMTPGIGSVSGRNLLRAFGDPAAIFSQSAATLRAVVQARQAQALLQLPSDFEAIARFTQQWLQGERRQHHMLVLGDPRYPFALLEIDDPPLVLYAAGSERALNCLDASRSIAIVGSRNPTPQGLENSRAFGKALAQEGLTVVSGMALGVDAAAHRGALESDEINLPTIAVVGTGLDRVYPAKHHHLAGAIAERGLVLSEYPLGTVPLPANFPRRNRLIAGLSRGTLVIEAALQSGSLITAQQALDQGKEVFAIPGSIHSTQSRGCHALIKQGAQLVESVQDIFDALGLDPGATLSEPFADANQTHTDPSSEDGDTDSTLADALGYDPASLEILQVRTGWDTGALQAHLMELELQGRVARLPGGLFQRIQRNIQQII